MEIKRPHRIWCNCDECVRWRGCRVPEARVKALDAQLEVLNTRPMRPFLIGVDFASGPDQSVASTQQFQEDIARASGVSGWKMSTRSASGPDQVLTTRDVAFLKEMRIDPWK